MITRNLLLIAGLVLLGACEDSRTVDGKVVECYGLNGDPQPGIAYEYSTRNVIVGLLTWEIIVPPIVIAFDELKCPKKVQPPKAPAVKA